METSDPAICCGGTIFEVEGIILVLSGELFSRSISISS